MNKIKKIVSGGQSGVDRAAIDFAIEHNIDYGGWCPKGGWAEDLPKPPGLLKIYKRLVETPSSDTKQRTKRNVGDSDITIIISDNSVDNTSKGTNLTIDTAIKLQKQIFQININKVISNKIFLNWMSGVKNKNIVVNIAGPRESESPGIYHKTREVLEKLLN